jgi:hypothetical protein
MIRFFKELYLTGFTLLYKIPGGTPHSKTGTSVPVIALFEVAFLAGVLSWIDISNGKRFLLSSSNSLASHKIVFLFFFIVLSLVNYHILVTRGHGIKYEREFNNLKKSRKILLVTSCCGLALATIAFFIYSRFAYRRFFHIF